MTTRREIIQSGSLAALAVILPSATFAMVPGAPAVPNADYPPVMEMNQKFVLDIIKMAQEHQADALVLSPLAFLMVVCGAGDEADINPRKQNTEFKANPKWWGQSDNEYLDDNFDPIPCYGTVKGIPVFVDAFRKTDVFFARDGDFVHQFQVDAANVSFI